jgi:hypothetical protein
MKTKAIWVAKNKYSTHHKGIFKRFRRFLKLTHGVGELAVTRTVIKGLDDDSLLAGVAASEHDNYLAVLDAVTK